MNTAIGKIRDSVQDARSGRLIFLSHCILNQNACVRGLASYPGVVSPLVQELVDQGIGIYQMPCPEVSYLGSQRWGHVKEQYGNPMFRRHCRRLAEQICDQIQTYRDNKHEVIGVVFRDGSPTCGLKCAAVSADDQQIWGGMVWGASPLQAFAPTEGVYVEEMQRELKARQLDNLSLMSIPEVDEAGSMGQALQEIRHKLEESCRTS